MNRLENMSIGIKVNKSAAYSRPIKSAIQATSHKIRTAVKKPSSPSSKSK